MKHITDDVRIREIKELSPPAHILREFPTTDARRRKPPGRRARPCTACCTAPTTAWWW
jgi:hypothetical protein